MTAPAGLTLSTRAAPAVPQTQDSAASFVRLMRRYVFDYTNCGDQAVTRELMEPDYELFMGDHAVRGRDIDYHAATAKQMTQFPGLGLTVHEIATSGQRLVMRFSEHGASQAHDGKLCAWGGIGLYAWNGEKLVRNFVEQDYWSRRRQLAGGAANPVEGPAIAAWTTPGRPSDAGAEASVLEWLALGRLATTDGVLLDDQWFTGDASPLIEQDGIEVDDIFSCGTTVAFHAKQKGAFVPGDDLPGVAGTPAYLHMSGLVHVSDQRVTRGRIIRNRIDLARRLQGR